jgi:hypothetical protein
VKVSIATCCLVFAAQIGCNSDISCIKPVALSPPGPKGCATREYLYDDGSCGAGVGPCMLEGDNLCHARCDADTDCPDPCRPYCRILGLFQGHDVGCEAGVKVCREAPKDDCDPRTVILVK